MKGFWHSRPGQQAAARTEDKAAVGKRLLLLAEKEKEKMADGVPISQAVRRLYQKSAACGVAEAQCELGRIYRTGDGVRSDIRRAVRYYGQAAAQGDVDALMMLGWMYMQGEGVEKNYAKSRACFTKAAARGCTDALVNLGAMYEYGYGVGQDYIQAIAYY